jgi:anaerobic selenocysteine-containing dehydrogenase
MPDPMTTASWNTWVELNPATARSLQVDNNDVVKVVSPYGELHAPVVVYPGIRPDAVAIPIGQGHRDYGRFAQGRGSNPLALLAPPSEQALGSWLPWGATRVRIERTGRKQELARVESLDGAGREKLR